jgi:hypothetical protein
LASYRNAAIKRLRGDSLDLEQIRVNSEQANETLCVIKAGLLTMCLSSRTLLLGDCGLQQVKHSASTAAP